MNVTPDSKAAAYLRGHHPNLALTFALALCGCTAHSPAEAVKEVLPEASEETALGIILKVTALCAEEECGCEFLLDSGVTIGHLAQALEQLESQLVAAVQENPRAGVQELKGDLARGLLALFRGEDPAEALAPIIEKATAGREIESALEERIDRVLASMGKLASARVCMLAHAQKEAAFERMDEIVAARGRAEEREEPEAEPQLEDGTGEAAEGAPPA